MKYLRVHRGSSLALAIILVLGIQLVYGASQGSSSNKQSKSGKKLDSSHPIQPKPESRSSKSAIDHQVAGVAPSSDKKQVDTIEAQESSVVSSVASAQPTPALASASAPSSSSSATSSSDSTSNNNEEYVQIKPEEINVNEHGKEIEPSLGASASQSAAESAEHKSSVDDELNAHLVQDIINQQESGQQSYSAPAPRSSGGSHKPRHRPQPGYGSPRPSSRKPIAGRELAPRHPRAFPGSNRVPPHYIALKGKLTGFNSIVSQYPHPAPGYPHHGPRHLPRGAAAGYAAFRDFVRAHANKYKHTGPQATYGMPAGLKEQVSHRPAGHSEYPGAQSNQASGYPHQSGRTKVTVTQAFIPHLASGGSQQGYSSPLQQQQHMSAYGNPMLSKLYGGHAPQGVGRPEYNKDYGMVIHYPQATVYTEPMTVDQLYKLTGGGISHVIEQLQYNLAHGYRDDSNMIRANNKHHIGHGIAIHAKEYHAPGKSGQYVPTTAAVITTSSNSKGSYSSGEQSASPGGSREQAASVDLGAGYDRVRQAVSQGQSAKYNNMKPAEQSSPSHASYDQGLSAGSYESLAKHNGEPLSAISGLIGSELESLYKANHALNKQIEPEIHSQIQSFMKNSQHASRPLKYADLDQRSPFVLQAQSHNKYSNLQPGYRQAGQRGNRKGQHPRSNRYAHRQPSLPNQHWHPQQYSRPQQQQQSYQYQHQSQQYGHLTGKVPTHQQLQHAGYQQQQQIQNYQAAEQALNQQMTQLLQDFNHGEEQYNGKSQPSHATSQGYPQKVLQKHQKQQQQYQNAAQLTSGAHEGIEIPQGPNDQVGEIADLLEALKGSLEMSGHLDPQSGYGDKSQSGELTKDVRYLASALGQTPSYAMQVPVSAAPAHEAQADHKQQTELYQHQQHGSTDAQQASYRLTGKQQGERQAYYQQAQGYAQAQPAAQQVDSGIYGLVAGQPQSSAELQHQQAVEYTHQQAQTQAIVGNPQTGGYGSPVQSSAPVVNTYPQPAPTAAAQDASYSSNEHTQVINHLVPAAESTPSSASGYESSPSSHQAGASVEAHQPVNQIAVAAPTDSQYQNAQPLSSFVDSLPTDYQELLRQPALVSGHSSVPHLAALGQEAPQQAAPSGAYSNTTSAQANDSSASQSHSSEDSSTHHQEDLRKLYHQQAHQASATSQAETSNPIEGQGQQQQQPQYRKA